MIEIWKDIKDYEGLYQVSNLGRVKSLKRTRINNGGSITEVKECILKPLKVGGGYLCVILSKNGIYKQYLIHRLVAQAFIPNPNNLPQVNHKDESRDNNCVWNLEWCTAKYNNNYGTRMDKYISSRLKVGNNRPVLQYTLDDVFVAEYPSTMEAQRQTGICNVTISLCCLGKRKSAGHYKWYRKVLT